MKYLVLNTGNNGVLFELKSRCSNKDLVIFKGNKEDMTTVYKYIQVVESVDTERYKNFIDMAPFLRSYNEDLCKNECIRTLELDTIISI